MQVQVHVQLSSTTSLAMNADDGFVVAEDESGSVRGADDVTVER